MKKFISVDGKTVSYQVWGSTGPVIIALHGSPQSARAVAHVCEALAAKGFVVIAPDTPGNGLSDPLLSSEKTTIVDYAAALHRFVENLGISSHGIYGFHTGAAIACTYAALYPNKANSIFFDGLPNWSADERESLVGYLASFEPKWDGSHMTWLWARMEEQTVLVPWHHASSQYRMDYNVSPAEACHANVMDLLKSKNNYIQPYAEALKFNPGNWISLLTSPYICAASFEDVLKEHLTRPGLKDVTGYVYDTREEMYDTASRLFDENKAEAITLDPPKEMPCGFTDFGSGQVYWQGNPWQNTNSPTIVFLHGSGDSGTNFTRLAKSMNVYTNTLSFDLPGHGYSNDCSSLSGETIATLAKSYHEACLEMGINNYVVVGERLGGLIANEMLVKQFCQRAICIDIQQKLNKQDWQDLESINCLLTPQWDGSHLVRAWRIARWETLFTPWFKRDRKHARVISGEQLEPKDIQKRAETLLMAKDEWLSALALESEADTQDIKTPHMVEYSSCTLTDASPSHIGNISASKDDWFVTLSKQFAF
jgi:haloalkane dehalogenase